MEWFAIGIAFIVAGGAFAIVLGRASDLGHGERRQSPRCEAPLNAPLDFDTEFL